MAGFCLLQARYEWGGKEWISLLSFFNPNRRPMLFTALALSLSLSPTQPVFDDWGGLRNAVIPMGDVNGDGMPDFAVGHRGNGFDLRRQGPVEMESQVWILSGKDGAVIHSLQGGPSFGIRMANVGDLDGDGVNDLAGSEKIASDSVIDTACLHFEEGGTDALHDSHLSKNPKAGHWSVRIISGATGQDIAALGGEQNLRGFGKGIAGGLQITGDKTPDLLVGIEGCAWLVDGATLLPTRAFRMDEMGVIHQIPVTAFQVPPLPEGVDPASTKIKANQSL